MREKTKEERVRSVIHWVIGMIVCPLGVCLSVKSGFGVSMIEAPVFVLYNFISKYFSWYTFGTSEYIIQGLLMIALFFAVRKFNWKYLLSFGTAVLYGLILDLWYRIFGKAVYPEMWMRIIAGAAGIIIIAFAVAMFFRTFMPQEVWELFVKELSEHYHLNMTKTKWIYDISSLAVGIILMLVLFRKFDLSMIGIGTIVTTAVNAPIIGLWGKLIDRIEGKKAAA